MVDQHITTEITGERSESALIDLLGGRLVAFRLRQSADNAREENEK